MRAVVRGILGAILAVGSPAALAHDGHSNDTPWRACDDQHLGDACAYENSAKDIYRGTCRSMSDELMCVRNRPIEKYDPNANEDPAEKRRLLPREAG